MTPLALVFMISSWTLVLGLTGWAFKRVLAADQRRRRRTGEADRNPE